MVISQGIYEQIINTLFRRKLERVDTDRFFIGKKPITKHDAIHLLSKYLENLIETVFASSDENLTVEQCTDFVNTVITTLGQTFSINDSDSNLIDAGNTILTAVIDKKDFNFPDIEEYVNSITPATSLCRSTLFIGGNSPIDMQSELNKEILSADEICWVVSAQCQTSVDKSL